jgi:hypothetical protein
LAPLAFSTQTELALNKEIVAYTDGNKWILQLKTQASTGLTMPSLKYEKLLVKYLWMLIEKSELKM